MGSIHKKPSPVSTSAARSTARTPALPRAGARSRPLQGALSRKTAKNFDVKEVSADKGYSSLENHDAIAKVGATPYIAFKANATGEKGGLFQKMYHYYQYKRDEFLAFYHKRSNVESTFNRESAP